MYRWNKNIKRIPSNLFSKGLAGLQRLAERHLLLSFPRNRRFPVQGKRESKVFMDPPVVYPSGNRGGDDRITIHFVLDGLLVLFFICFLLCPPEVFAYDSGGQRDPFVPLVGVTRLSSGGIGGILSIDDVMLQGIVRGPDGSSSVIINGELMKKGDKAGRMTIGDIGANTVIIKISDQTHSLSLYE